MMIKDKFHLIGSDNQKNKEIVIQSLGEILEELNNTNIAVKLLSSRVGGSAEFSEYEEETVWEAIGRLQDADGEIDIMTERLEVALGSIEMTIEEHTKGLKTLDSSLKNLNKHYRETFKQFNKIGQTHVSGHVVEVTPSGSGYGARILELEKGLWALKSLERRVSVLARQAESDEDSPGRTPVSRSSLVSEGSVNILGLKNKILDVEVRLLRLDTLENRVRNLEDRIRATEKSSLKQQGDNRCDAGLERRLEEVEKSIGSFNGDHFQQQLNTLHGLVSRGVHSNSENEGRVEISNFVFNDIGDVKHFLVTNSVPSAGIFWIWFLLWFLWCLSVILERNGLMKSTLLCGRPQPIMSMIFLLQ